MTTSWQAEPGTSTPCHSDSVPNRQVAASRANCAHQRRGLVLALAEDVDVGPSRSRIASAAASAARCEENSPRVRPPAARISSSISSSASGDVPSRPGAGRCLAT